MQSKTSSSIILFVFTALLSTGSVHSVILDCSNAQKSGSCAFYPRGYLPQKKDSDKPSKPDTQVYRNIQTPSQVAHTNTLFVIREITQTKAPFSPKFEDNVSIETVNVLDLVKSKSLIEFDNCDFCKDNVDCLYTANKLYPTSFGVDAEWDNALIHVLVCRLDKHHVEDAVSLKRCPEAQVKVHSLKALTGMLGLAYVDNCGKGDSSNPFVLVRNEGEFPIRGVTCGTTQVNYVVNGVSTSSPAELKGKNLARDFARLYCFPEITGSVTIEFISASGSVQSGRLLSNRIHI